MGEALVLEETVRHERLDRQRPWLPKRGNLRTTDRPTSGLLRSMSVGSCSLGGVDGEVMFDSNFKATPTSLIRAAMAEDFDTAELIISQHDPTS